MTTLDACKTSCVAAVEQVGKMCDGIIFNPGTKSCYRKMNIQIGRCGHDPKLNLYVRTDPNRPPAAPKAVYDGYLTDAKCQAFMRDPDHKFYAIWGERGWNWRRRGQDACWGDGNWFDWVARGDNCNQKWGTNMKAATVFGFAESMEAFCNDRAGRGWTFNAHDPSWACGDAGYNVLRIGGWNMCRNAEWMVCVIQGKACWGGGGDGQIIFSMAPMMLDMAEFNSRDVFYSENDIYYLEVCTINEMCSNNHEIWSVKVGDPFFCKFDPQKWNRLKNDLMRIG